MRKIASVVMNVLTAEMSPLYVSYGKFYQNIQAIFDLYNPCVRKFDKVVFL